MISHHAALVYAMVVGAAADGSVSDSELETIRGIVEHLPVFADFERGNLDQVAAAAAEMLTEDDGVDTAIDLIKSGLTERLRPTAYALACDIVAADGKATQEELQYLQMLRYGLDVDRLTAAAIERGAAARYAKP